MSVPLSGIPHRLLVRLEDQEQWILQHGSGIPHRLLVRLEDQEQWIIQHGSGLAGYRHYYLPTDGDGPDAIWEADRNALQRILDEVEGGTLYAVIRRPLDPTIVLRFFRRSANGRGVNTLARQLRQAYPDAVEIEITSDPTTLPSSIYGVSRRAEFWRRSYYVIRKSTGDETIVQQTGSPVVL